MSNFDRVLSDACYMDILAKINGFSATSEGEVYVGSGDDVLFQLAEFAERVEQAAIAKYKAELAEREPVAWLIPEGYGARVTLNANEADHLKNDWKLYIKPLYTLNSDT